MYLFQKDINDWNSWGAVYQSINDFQKLIEEIFKREKLFGYEHISQLTPGTNAVFKVGNTVIKIFAPIESGAKTDEDYCAELQSMERANTLRIRAPKLIAASHIQDKYVFRYLIMEYIDGQSAGNALEKYTSAQKRKFVLELKENLMKMNCTPTEEVNESLVKERSNHNMAWNSYPITIQSQIKEIVKQYDLSECVYVHGDLTADNIIIDKQDDLYIIDFADSTIAPIEYEYPPILFDLFNYDIEMINEFNKELDYDAFIDKVFMGTLLHAFGAYFIKITYEKFTGKKISELVDIYEVKRLMYTGLKK
jgi:tRNA A-37 threonylcarbamoyl transferase component Bud32